MERPPIKDKAVIEYVDHLEKELQVYERSPYVDSYIACLKTIGRWNKQLTDKEIDIFEPEDKDKFAMAHKFLTEIKPYLDQLDYLRKSMNPAETKKAEEALKKDGVGIAEQIAMKNGAKD